MTLYEIPFGRGKRWGGSTSGVLNHLFGNWTLGGTYVAQTGSRFHPTFAGTDPGNTNIRSGRADRIADGTLPSDQRTLQRWFDTTAFVTPADAIGRFGTSGPFVLEGPGLSVFHAGLYKDVVFHERLRLRLEAVSTNALNHPNFGNPSTVVGTPAYGQVLTMHPGDGNRNYSLTARIVF
jgi:hypothetical protein